VAAGGEITPSRKGTGRVIAMVEEAAGVGEAAIEEVGKLEGSAGILGGGGAGVEESAGVEGFKGRNREQAIQGGSVAVDKVPVGACKFVRVLQKQLQ
jgi:hypothetical protein